MEAKHTAGPWRSFSLVSKAGRNKIAIQTAKSRLCDVSIYDDEDIANVRSALEDPS